MRYPGTPQTITVYDTLTASILGTWTVTVV